MKTTKHTLAIAILERTGFETGTMHLCGHHYITFSFEYEDLMKLRKSTLEQINDDDITDIKLLWKRIDVELDKQNNK